MNEPPGVLVATERDTAVLEVFNGLAEAQRGEPEGAMLRLQDAVGGGEFSWLVEHMGDLTNRMAKMWHAHDAGYEYMTEKVVRGERILNRLAQNPGAYGINVDSNADYTGVPRSVYRARVDRRRVEYVEAHRRLVVYNRAQFLARQVAIQVGACAFMPAWLAAGALKDLLQPFEFFMLQFPTDEDRVRARVALDERYGEGNALPSQIANEAERYAVSSWYRACREAWRAEAMKYLPGPDGLPVPYPWAERGR